MSNTSTASNNRVRRVSDAKTKKKMTGSSYAKQQHGTKGDHILFITGATSITLVGAFIANGFFKGHIESLLVEAILYIAIIAMYIKAIRNPRVNSLIQLMCVISYVSVITLILTLSFIAYFVATYQW